MAEYLFKKMAKENGLEIEVRSAGVSIGINSQIPVLTLRVLEKEGISPEGHVVTPLTNTLVDWADLILAMETPHANRVLDFGPAARGKVFLLTEYTNAGNTALENKYGIPDPFGGSREAYETCIAKIKGCLGRLVEMLKGEKE